LDGDGPAHEVTVIDPAGRVIDRSLLIAQEELELARLELVEKIPLLGRGLLQLALAAALALIGAILGTLAIAWLLADYVFGIRHVWASLALMAAVVLLGAAIIALRAIRRARRRPADAVGGAAPGAGVARGGAPMSTRRTIAEVEHSIEANRGELVRALDDLRAGARHATDIRGHVERYVARGRELGERDGEALVGALGFVAGGGASGTARLPVKAARIVTGRPRSTSRLEVHMRQDRHSRQLGRALSALAAADGHMRSRRRRWIRRLGRGVLLLGSTGPGLAVAMADGERRDALVKKGDELLDRLMAA
jgi:uncharacterized membrane protein YqjE